MTRYACVLKGGSVGEEKSTKIFETKEEAQEYGKSWVKSFGGGRRSYYRPGYNVRKVSEREEAEIRLGTNPWWMRI